MAHESETQSEAGAAPCGPSPLMEAARGWVADCEWKETLEYGIDPAEDFTDQEIVAGIDHHYEGGWAQFCRDTRLEGPDLSDSD